MSAAIKIRLFIMQIANGKFQNGGQSLGYAVLKCRNGGTERLKYWNHVILNKLFQTKEICVVEIEMA